MAAEGVHTGAHATVGSEGSGLGRVEPWSRHGVHGRATPLSPSALLSNVRTVVTEAQDSAWSAQRVASTALFLSRKWLVGNAVERLSPVETECLLDSACGVGGLTRQVVAWRRRATLVWAAARMAREARRARAHFSQEEPWGAQWGRAGSWGGMRVKEEGWRRTRSLLIADG